ncbi:bud site selection-related protein [Wallemia mellicola]|uniref:Bud site selection-related protein n=1 Tax=Wallemia mellicola TaxID=1708541 RepID=A0AB74K913_9BASI|nr:bud site selection-related protein [Wallemia mellicola]TIC21902.1 bud site selection-related protein [Wallemia mellicola]TIC34018.1 bud site selection-related protein [Wallemia mellicola]TIC53870.1 bud site selection-related protein [Wallemia mellicola]TIC59130.1 bud site selection-related protein [Wallemia mellicola]
MPGPSRRSRTGASKRDIHRASRTRARTKDLDQVQLEDLLPENKAKLENQPLDETLPGLGQHYCIECARYFESDVALKGHSKTKVHRRRLKDLKEPAYTQAEADAAVGLGVDKTQRSLKNDGQAIKIDS